MKMRSVFLIFVTFLLFVEIQAIRKQEVRITYPERLDHHRSKRDLSTAIHGEHEASASFSVNDWVLDTKRNNELTPKTVTVRHFLSDDTEVIREDSPDGCHYQGSIRGVPDSTVVLNTCDGLRGLIDDGKETFHIEPHDEQKDTGAHKLYPENDEEFDAERNCGTHSEDHFHYATDADESNLRATITRGSGSYKGRSSILRQIINTLAATMLEMTDWNDGERFLKLKQSVVNMEEKYRSYLTTDETRYNEVLFVVDNKVYQRYGNNTKTVTDKVLTLCNAVDAIYQRINVRVVMTAIEIWTNGDRIERQTSGGAELGKFQEYRQRELIGKIHHDNGQFISIHGWSGGVIGMAWVGTMCNRLSAGINTWSSGSIIGPYVTVAHEMGHNFGYNHDTGYCKCLTPKGCFMGGHKTRVPGFSNCSLESMKRINDRCLYNKPKVLIPQCGNGIQEGDEECDCGTPEMCAAKDPCCQPHGCKLKPSSVCSDLHHSCCKDCQYKRQGTLCRAAETDCDVPESCPGNSRDCPVNNYVQNGIPCNQTEKLFVGNTNRNSIVTRSFSPRIEARYVRINPQSWYQWICMRAELYGCSAHEVNPTTPTPIKPYYDYCVVPKNATAIPHENSRLIFKWGRTCKQAYMDFRLDADGVLWHHSSGRRVCPENGGTGNSVRLVISSSCTNDDSKYIRTAKYSLKHVKTGKCIHPNGGWPGNDRELLIYSGCNQRRLELHFMKPDCIMPLGLSTQEIPDDQITASSSRGSDLPHFGRLHNNKYWCAKQKKNTEYLQIDLGKVQTINKMGTQGRRNWNDWVTGYFVEYSQDGQRWTKYSESGNSTTSNSYCFSGKCAETRDTQCRDLWGPASNNANQGCYEKLNKEANGFGTCNPVSNSSCTASNVLCGQIQCLSSKTTPVVDYGKTYRKFTLEDSSQCSAAVLKTDSDFLGLGMVADGTKCGDKKMCSNYECKSFAELTIQACPMANGKECNGQGVCTNTGVCHCDGGYDPATACVQALVARDGGYGAWSDWSTCSAGCNGGTQSRHRFCNNPFPQHNGKDCQGERVQQRDCNTDACPRVHSCRQLHQTATEQNKLFPDGVYKIYPYGLDKPITTYCDMSRDGGGWTLLVTSHTNSWTSQNVRLRNEDSPSLASDYSILKYADDIKNNLNVVGLTFEYRLEAQSRGRWGGIWQADRSYTFTATTNKQTDVQLIKKFDNWNYANNGIEKRMPWISGAKLTTSGNANSNWWGTITANEVRYHPAPWISGHLMENQPEYIWYWMREGPWKLPRSCMEVQMRGLQTIPQQDGVYSIKPPGKKEVKTYCDFTSLGGGWTLLATSKTHTGWTADNVKERNTGNPSLDADYSILGVADAIKDFDVSQDFFQYRIEADGSNQYGGIFDAPRQYTFTSTCDKQTNVKMVENFSGIAADTNLARRMPRLGLSSNVFLSSGSTASDLSGSIIYNAKSAESPSYLPSVKPNPGVVRYWMREGTRRSCNDIKLHGTRLLRQYADDYYMIRLANDSTYFPVFCDMTSDPGAFTLVVTSRHNSWTRDQVPARNVYRPSISHDYSILKYADAIKNLGHNSTFKYKLDANQRGHWGGVWSAPRYYSFMFTSNTQAKVTLLKKFDTWTMRWWKTVENRMPWFYASGVSNQALLTTSTSPTYYPAGSIIWGGTDRHPADWIWDGGMRDPGVIWYWVNEDDCDSDRQPVNGGFSDWGSWGKCDKLCANGKEIRRRTCTNPEPRCGGLQCSASAKTVEERACYTCPESPIRSYGGYCVQPKSGDCNPQESTTTWSHSLIFKRADANCSAEYMKFLFDSDGRIYHKCSGKIVCPDGNNVHNNRKLVLKESCPQEVSMHRRLPSKSLQNKKNNYCVHPLGGWPGENRYLVYYKGCDVARLSLDFFKLPPP